MAPKIYGNWIGGSYLISLVHPDTTKLLVGVPKETRKAWNYRFFNPWLGQRCLFLQHGAGWQRARKVFTGMFKNEMLLGYMNAYTTSTQSLIDIWRRSPHKVVDLHKCFSLLTLDLALQAGFGCESHCQETTEQVGKLPEYFGAMNKMVWNRTVNPMLWTDIVYNRYQDGIRTRQYIEFINNYCSTLIKKRRTDIDQGIDLARTSDGESLIVFE